MDLTQLANLGEFIGGVAVLVTLVYLAIQVRTQARESRLASVHTVNLAYGTFLDSLIESKEVRQVFLEGLQDFESLEQEQRLLFSCCGMKLFRFHESAFHLYEAGRIEQDIWKTFDQPTTDLLQYPGLQSWWATRSEWFGGRFQGYINGLIDHGVGSIPYG